MRRQKGKWVGLGQWVGFVCVAFLLTACASPRLVGSQSAEDSAAPAAGRDFGGEPAAEAGMVAADGIERKVTAHAVLNLVVDDTQAVVDQINALVEELGGYVSSTNLYKSSYSGEELLQGSMSVRVPSEHLDAAMDRLEALALDVNSRSIDRQDVTDQYSDLEAQIRNLEATEKELLAMLEEVRERSDSTPEDIMAVYRELTTVRGQIELLEGQKNLLDNLIALSVIDISLTPDMANLPVIEEGWRPLVVVREASRTLVSGLQGLVNLAIWLVIVVLPILILIAIPIVLLILLIRWLRDRSIRRRNAKEKSTAVEVAEITEKNN